MWKNTALPRAWRERLDSFAELDVEFESSFSRFASPVMSEKENNLQYLSTVKDNSLKNIMLFYYILFSLNT